MQLTMEPSGKVKTGICKQVLSGDAIIIRGAPRNGPPREEQVNLSGVTAPRLARRVANAAAAADSPPDEPYAWESREFLRKKLVGHTVTFVSEVADKNARQYGTVYLGTDTETGENINETMVAEGLVQVRREGGRDNQRLIDLENNAKAQAKGRWAPDAAEHVRKIIWSVDSPRTLVEKFARCQVPAVIEHVRDGSTVRAFLLPDMYYVTVMLSGVRCPTMRIGSDNRPDPVQAEEYFEMARFFVEARILQRDVHIVLESVNNANYVGSVLHPNGNISELLLREGLARCVDWSIVHAQAGVETLRAAERFAKDKRLRLWKDYVPANCHLSDKERDFTGKVVEVVNGDALMVKLADGSVKKVFLSSVRSPRLDKNPPAAGASAGEQQQQQRPKNFRPLYDIPYMFEAREILRRRVIGQRVSVHVDYVQPGGDLPERCCCTVLLSGVNLAELLVKRGLATVVQYRADNERRSSHYDALLAAEMHAKKAGTGLHGRRTDAATVKVHDQVADVGRTRSLLQRSGRVQWRCVVEYVASGSRLRVFIPQESTLSTVLLAGIQCPRAARNTPAPSTGTATNQQQYAAEPYGQEAYHFTRDLCMQRDVQVELVSADKGGNYIGWVLLDNGARNLSVELVAAGLSYVHSSAESTVHYNQLLQAEEKARAARKGVWTDYVEPVNGDDAATGAAAGAGGGKRHATASASGAADTDSAVRKEHYRSVVVTAVTPEARFFVQYTDKGPELEVLMNSLRADLVANPPVVGAYRPKRGDLCGAKYKDGEWYRAKVERIPGPSQASVIYIDYGNRDTVPFTDCISLPSGSGTRYSSAPRFAKEYALALTRLPADEDLAADCVEAFAQSVCGRQLQLNVEYRDTTSGLEFASLREEPPAAAAAAEAGASSSAAAAAGGEEAPAAAADVAMNLLEQGLLMVQSRPEGRLARLLAQYRAAQERALRARASIWRYGDITEDDATEFGR